jgi:hypothetical protein
LPADFAPDFFPEYINIGRRGDAKPDLIAFDRNNGDRHITLWYHDSFADLATEDEHEKFLLELALFTCSGRLPDREVR